MTLGGSVTYNAGTATFENGMANISADLSLGAASRTFTVNDSTVSVDLLVSGAIGEGVAGRGLTKAGAGVLELAGTNTYTGATTINAGTVLVTGSISGSTTTVNATGILGGSGTTGAVIVAASGTVSPGSSPGTLSTGNFDLSNATSTLTLEISAPGAGNFDQLNVTGTVTLGGLANVSLFPGSTANLNDTFLVILNDGVDGVVNPLFANDVGGVIAGLDGSSWGVNYAAGSDNNDVQLTLLAIPEPNSLAMLASSLGMAIGLQRFRRRSAPQS